MSIIFAALMSLLSFGLNAENSDLSMSESGPLNESSGEQSDDALMNQLPPIIEEVRYPVFRRVPVYEEVTVQRRVPIFQEVIKVMRPEVKVVPVKVRVPKVVDVEVPVKVYKTVQGAPMQDGPLPPQGDQQGPPQNGQNKGPMPRHGS